VRSASRRSLTARSSSSTTFTRFAFPAMGGR
jgi:hypothetical protein